MQNSTHSIPNPNPATITDDQPPSILELKSAFKTLSAILSYTESNPQQHALNAFPECTQLANVFVSKFREALESWLRGTYVEINKIAETLEEKPATKRLYLKILMCRDAATLLDLADQITKLDDHNLSKAVVDWSNFVNDTIETNLNVLKQSYSPKLKKEIREGIPALLQADMMVKLGEAISHLPANVDTTTTVRDVLLTMCPNEQTKRAVNQVFTSSTEERSIEK